MIDFILNNATGKRILRPSKICFADQLVLFMSVVLGKHDLLSFAKSPMQLIEILNICILHHGLTSLCLCNVIDYIFIFFYNVVYYITVLHHYAFVM